MMFNVAPMTDEPLINKNKYPVMENVQIFYKTKIKKKYYEIISFIFFSFY